MKVRSLAFAVSAVIAFAAGGLAADTKGPSPTPHPHFNDAGTLSWSKKLADAQTAAKATNKLIFIEYGREA